MTSRLVLVFLISALILLPLLSTPALSKEPKSEDNGDDLDEDLSFLEADDDDDAIAEHNHHSDPHQFDEAEDDDVEDEDFENYDDFDEPSGFDHEAYSQPEIDEKDVIVLKEGNFSEFIENNRYVMVEFYAPWCRALPGTGAGVRGSSHRVKGRRGGAREGGRDRGEPYPGQRTKDGIITWIKKKIGPGVYNITTTEDAERVQTSENKVVLGFLNSLVGTESEELAGASRLEDDINFYQTVNPDVAKLFHMDLNVKRPALVMLKKEAEKLSHFDGQFKKSAIVEFVSANKLPLVTNFTRESGPMIFESPIKKQLLLFSTSNDSEKVVPTFQEAAKLFKGKLIFVYVEMDDEDVGRPVSDYFGVTGNAPRVLAYTGNDDAKKYVLNGEVTLDKIKAFGEDFLEDKLKTFYKSDPVPETNDGDVKIVVGNNFDEIVLDESKDVLLEIYAPWCGHCQALEPTYNKLARHLRGIESIVIAKMDGTTNEHPRAKAADGFPTLLFFPAGNKSFDPITVDTDRTVVAFYKFLKKHASIPFKLQKPALTPKSEGSNAKESIDSSINDLKDEL
ncbi:hypothetical protein F0562_021781 [Nyssa sinensis]|uniref:protein disulfide-isomerase n=1 Tax=Nyssa sinensis TaxID=561372 RepID=A0A5J5BQP4_9ASTE|nr:hypothetical protein F0562_021781 [Nyssa sinensis]